MPIGSLLQLSQICNGTQFKKIAFGLGGLVWLLPLLWIAGGKWGNGKCQKRRVIEGESF